MTDYVTKSEFKTALDKVDARFDKVEGRLDNVEKRLLPLEEMKADIKAVLVQNEQTHKRLDAILEYLPGLTPLGPKVAQLEETSAEHDAAVKLNRYHLNELRRDFDSHQHQPRTTT